MLPAAVQAQFTFTTNNGAITITSYTGSGGAVVIPGTTNGYPVTSIGNSAFFNKFRVTSVTIPNSVTNIGDNAFSSCHSLTNVTIGTNVISIGNAAFVACSLTSVTIPNSVTSIGDNAFYSCINLTSVTIPNSVTSIGTQAFQQCYKLTAITVDANNPAYCSVGGVLFNQSQTTLIQCPGGKAGSYTISNSVTSIGTQAFECCNGLTNVMIPNSVTNIGDNAFYSCINLTSVTIPNSVTSIGDGTFDDCYRLTSVTIPDSVTSIGRVAFAGCGLTSMTIPNSVTNIGDFAFSGCSSITNFTIPDSVTSIGEGAFYSCASLTSITIPNSVTSIGGHLLFANCTSLTGVYFQGNAPSADSTMFSGDNSVTVYYLPGTTGWGNFAQLTGRPTVLWNPQAQTSDASFGVRTNKFGFNIIGSSNLVIVVEACTNLSNPTWFPLQTNTLNTFIGTNGASYFSDPQWMNYPGRFYRLRSL